MSREVRERVDRLIAFVRNLYGADYTMEDINLSLLPNQVSKAIWQRYVYPFFSLFSVGEWYEQIWRPLEFGGSQVSQGTLERLRLVVEREFRVPPHHRIRNLKLSGKARKVLVALEVVTLEEVAQLSETDILTNRGKGKLQVGPVLLREIADVLGCEGLHLRVGEGQ